MARKVPEGWFNYRPYGSPIGSTRMIPVKTPLKAAFNSGRRVSEMATNGVPIEEELTPTQLVRKLESDGLVLGMVIDLTFTNRYYDPMEFEALGVKHMKHGCRGQEIPDDTVYQKVSADITEFLQNMDNRGKLIAIHCTHGLNRTGYLVCRYIMEHCGYSADKAIRAFNQARGHDIEKEEYLEHLRKGPTTNFLSLRSCDRKLGVELECPPLVKKSGPVNGDECYFWRTTGCRFGSRCRNRHVPEHKGIDS